MGPVKVKFYADVNKDILKEFADLEEEGIENSVQKGRKSKPSGGVTWRPSSTSPVSVT